MPDSNSIIIQLWHPDEQGNVPQVYVILDAARNGNIYTAIMDFDGEYCCLLGDDIPEVLAVASPYLVKLEAEHEFTTWLITEGWGDSWGIFLQSDAALEELRRHFRQFIKVQDEDGNELFFRYYDPRVLRPYLPTCKETELKKVFGQVNSFRVEAEDANAIIAYSCIDWKLNMDIIPIL